MGKIKNILFFCWGNSCRSPCAEYIAKGLKASKYKEELKDVNFESAGFYNFYDYAQPETVEFIESKGIDMNDFQGQIINDKLLEKQDLILGMEDRRHIRRLKRKFSHIRDIDKKAHLLLKYAGASGDLDIEDPINLPKEDYWRLLERVAWGVEKAIEKIIKINKNELD
ncbi:MAG: hypothetical protein GF383_13650 [Candidatus Lokiarchaeota archaeon]|nr:hypothetical protein [Candidatus Lokiarchaeota archaeon]MBD3342288.1 hypothetical protein [Candidatus Lokiarchaeota archaeon]